MGDSIALHRHCVDIENHEWVKAQKPPLIDEDHQARTT